MSEVTEAQSAVREFCLDVLRDNGHPDGASFDIETGVSSKVAYEKIGRLAIGELLLPIGGTFSDLSDRTNKPDLGLYLGDVDYGNLDIRVYNDLFGVAEEPSETKEWDNELTLVLGYHNGRLTQRISTFATSANGPMTPTADRELWSLDYAIEHGKRSSQNENPYKGHSVVVGRSFTDTDIIEFVDLARSFLPRKQ